jgi:hypothetical protein
VEHDYCAARVRIIATVLGCRHTGGLQAQRSVERECAIEVGNGEGYYINARFHPFLSSSCNHRRPLLRWKITKKLISSAVVPLALHQMPLPFGPLQVINDKAQV